MVAAATEVVVKEAVGMVAALEVLAKAGATSAEMRAKKMVASPRRSGGKRNGVIPSEFTEAPCFSIHLDTELQCGY